jgi:flagella basal body P-ring formation protein FlgA
MSKKVRLVVVLVLLLMFAPAVSHGGDEVVTITLKSSASVSSDEVSLGDIADISGGGDDVNEFLSGITVCPSIAIDTSRTLVPSDIEKQLAWKRVNMRFVRIDGARQVVVSRKSQKVTSEELKDVVLNYVYENMPWEQEEVIVSFSRELPDVSLPDEEATYSVTPLSGSRYIGYNQFALQIHSGGKLEQRFVVGMTIRVFKNVVVSSRQLRRRGIVGAEDVELQRHELKDVNKTAFSSIDDVVGQRLMVSVPANRILYHSFIEEAPLVTKDQYVIIRGKNGAVCVTARGRAIEEGKAGEFIQVKNLASGKVVIAKVTSSEIVDISATAAN